jgi:hypothetical protein
MAEAMNWCQRTRSEAERRLPLWMLNNLDMARSGVDPQTNGKMTRSAAVAYVNAHLPPGDPGRIT